MHHCSQSLVKLFTCSIVAVAVIANAKEKREGDQKEYESAEVVEALNALRNDIDARYGFRDGAPRVNLGPCGRFARDFRERWNKRFRDPVTIAFIMANNDASNCYHVLVRLPDGRYFDGGHGVMTDAFLVTLFPDSHIEEMRTFDLEVLDRRSYGLARAYPLCPHYSDDFTQSSIEKRLSELAGDNRHP
jgi:hypothetical protein